MLQPDAAQATLLLTVSRFTIVAGAVISLALLVLETLYDSLGARA
jgi:hypothetical protein